MSDYDKELLAFVIFSLSLIAIGYLGMWVVSLALAV